MIKTKFVFVVSLVAMLAVGSAWANTPGKDESVGAAHTVYTDQSPTSTEDEGGTTAIAGVTYVNRAVNKAGAAATAAEQHAAAAGKSALAAADSATQAASSAKSANDTLLNKQPKSTADYQMGNKSGGWTTMTTKQKDALDSGVTSATKVTRPANTAVGSETLPVYVNSKGVATAITSYEGTAAKATADESGNNIVNTYATKAELKILGDDQSDLVTTVNELTTGTQAKSTAAYQMGNASGGWTTMTAVQQNALNSGVTSETKVTHTASTAAGTESRPVYVTSAGVATAVTGMSIPYGKEFEPTSWATIWVE